MQRVDIPEGSEWFYLSDKSPSRHYIVPNPKPYRNVVTRHLLAVEADGTIIASWSVFHDGTVAFEVMQERPKNEYRSLLQAFLDEEPS